MPASPLSNTTCPRPSLACTQRSRSSVTSASRPTSGVRPRGLTTSNRLCQASTKVLRNVAVKALDDGGAGGLIGAHHLAVVFRVKVPGQDSRVH
jgi:hypothetical protein